MAKLQGQLFDRLTRTSGLGGVVEQYFITDEQRRMLGAVDALVFQGYLWSQDTNARVTFKMYHSSLRGAPPRKVGSVLTPGVGSAVVTAVGPFTFTVSTDFSADVEVVAEVDQNPASTQVKLEFELGVTPISRGK